MSVVVSFTDYTPAPRFDLLPWTDVRIEESDTEDGTFTAIDTIALSPVDPDPSDPAARSFTTENGTDFDMWYRVVFLDADADESQPTSPVQNTSTPEVSETPYATVAELAAILQVNPSTNAEALTRCLETGALEINSFLGRSEPFADVPAVVVQVNLDRAAEHWQQMKAPYGVLGLGSDVGPIFPMRNSFDRHGHKLASLKQSWGMA